MAYTSRIVGLMSGTSVDSIDAVLCDFHESESGRISAELIAFLEHPIPDLLRARIFRLFDDRAGSISLACSLNFEIGEAFGRAAKVLIESCDVPLDSITAIASHGQTAYHIPPHMASDSNLAYVPSTLQIGEPSVIAEMTGLKVVADFRVADMAVGGNGAPLVPFGDYHLFSQMGKGVVVHNIGGVANCTILPPSGKLEDVVAFDTGPGNMIVDALVHHFYPEEHYDQDGHHAQNGKILEDALDALMEMPYIQAPPPKTTGRELFGRQCARRFLETHHDAEPDDLIATATLFTARTLAVNLAKHVVPYIPISELLLAGGGARNPVMVDAIKMEVKAALGHSAPSVKLLDETGFPSKARECVAFAMLAHARLRGIPANVPSATGAKMPTLLGKIIDPSKSILSMPVLQEQNANS